MNTLSGSTTKSLRYEDIVVKAFELFPEEFALRGYPNYPDSSDIHKPLYGPLKRRGDVLGGKKQFRLTQKGLHRARELTVNGGKTRAWRGQRLTRDKEFELKRIFQTDAFRLFVGSQKERILDTDFYEYLGVTVRTPRNDFLGRLKTVEEAVVAAPPAMGASSRSIRQLHRFVITKFSNHIKTLREGL